MLEKLLHPTPVRGLRYTLSFYQLITYALPSEQKFTVRRLSDIICNGLLCACLADWGRFVFETPTYNLTAWLVGGDDSKRPSHIAVSADFLAAEAPVSWRSLRALNKSWKHLITGLIAGGRGSTMYGLHGDIFMLSTERVWMVQVHIHMM